MNLGERIYSLRTQKGMSQGDLAEALEVSRQSISKWETGGSVPELDKLIKLSQVFGITLDELVLDKEPEAAPSPPEPKVIYVEKQDSHSGRKTGGVVLLCFSALVWLLVSLLGDVLAGLVLASPFLACGLICLFVRRNVGLWCLWVVYAFADLYMRFATGVSWQFAFWRIGYSEIGNPGHLIIAWVWLLIFSAVVTTTVLRFRHLLPKTVRDNAIGTAASWAVYLVTRAIFALPTALNANEVVAYAQPARIVSVVSGWVQSASIAVALTFTVLLIITLWKKRRAQKAES
jgi:transcriptional regulator with XRE-family HTH domain